MCCQRETSLYVYYFWVANIKTGNQQKVGKTTPLSHLVSLGRTIDSPSFFLIHGQGSEKREQELTSLPSSRVYFISFLLPDRTFRDFRVPRFYNRYSNFKIVTYSVGYFLCVHISSSPVIFDHDLMDILRKLMLRNPNQNNIQSLVLFNLIYCTRLFKSTKGIPNCSHKSIFKIIDLVSIFAPKNFRTFNFYDLEYIGS